MFCRRIQCEVAEGPRMGFGTEEAILLTDPSTSSERSSHPESPRQAFFFSFTFFYKMEKIVFWPSLGLTHNTRSWAPPGEPALFPCQIPRNAFKKMPGFLPFDNESLAWIFLFAFGSHSSSGDSDSDTFDSPRSVFQKRLREADGVSMHWFTPEMPLVAKAGVRAEPRGRSRIRVSQMGGRLSIHAAVQGAGIRHLEMQMPRHRMGVCPVCLSTGHLVSQLWKAAQVWSHSLI